MTRLRELIVVFGTLGVIGFGGPAAHIALTRREVVERRGWLNDAQLVDLVGITNLIPGPNSTELAMLVGRMRAGGAGLVVAGLSFIVPAAGIVLALAWAYVTYGSTPTGTALLYGIKPVIIAIVAAALVAFARTALTAPLSVAVATAVAALWVLGVNELVLLAAGALIVAAARQGSRHPWVALGVVLLFTTATFIGYVLAGVPGAVVATMAIFLPAFLFVALVGPIADRLRRRPLTAALLDGINAAAIGLMAAVCVELGAEAIHDPLTILLALGAGAALLWGRVPSVVLVAIGGLAGVAAGVAGIGP